MGNNGSDFREKMSDRMLEFAVRIMNMENKLVKTYSGKHKSNLISTEDIDLKFLLPESYEFIKIFSSSLVTAKHNK